MYNERFQYLRDKYISPNNKHEQQEGHHITLEENSLQIQIEIAQKLKQLNETFLKKVLHNDYSECLQIVKQLEILLTHV